MSLAASRFDCRHRHSWSVLRGLSNASLLSLLLLGVGCSTKPVTVRAPYWPSWVHDDEHDLGSHLASAASAWDVLGVAAEGTVQYKRAKATYDYAVGSLIKDLSRRGLPKHWKNGHPLATNSGRYTLGFPDQPLEGQEVSVQSLDRLRLADTVKLGLSRATTEDGLGVPVVGQIMRSKEATVQQAMLPLNGAQLTLTAIVEFDPPPASDQPRRATLRLFSPRNNRHPVIEGRKIELAANYTSASRLALRDGFLRRFVLTGLLRADKVAGDCGLYLLEAYDPKRIPVVFVHGLLASPHNWYHAVNAINADPELRARYQAWYFLYPTGFDVPYAAQRLRESLIQARKTLDPHHQNPGMDQMVLVGHSMGGLLCRLQTVDSRDLFWQSCFTRTPDQLKLSPENRQRLISSLRFKRQPYVRRLIFVAVPHRGSSVADIHLLYRLRNLISLPADSLLLSKEVLTGNADALTPQLRTWGDYAFVSLGTLSPKHPYLKALNSEPISVPHHSIIGYIGNKPLEESSDGVVPYESAHLTTGTEVVVPRWHACADSPEGVAEIALRLKQHLREIR